MDATANRRWFQFSLTSLFVVITIAALSVGLLSWLRSQMQGELQLIDMGTGPRTILFFHCANAQDASDLADHLNTHNSLISNVINAGFQKNFNDFVNGFRVEIFKEKIINPKLQHLTLLAIAFDCGFNSKSTFNRAVKKATDKMPSEFLVKFGK